MAWGFLSGGFGLGFLSGGFCQGVFCQGVYVQGFVLSPSNNPQLRTFVADTAVSKTLLNNWTGRKSNIYAHLSRPPSTSGPFYSLPPAHSRKVKVTLHAGKGTIESYVYVINDKREQSLLGEQDAICLGIVKLHPKGATEAVSPDKPESEAKISRRISYPKRSEPPQDGIVSGRETQAEIDTNMKKLISQFPALFSTKTGKFQGWSNFKEKSTKCPRMILLKDLSKLRRYLYQQPGHY